MGHEDAVYLAKLAEQAERYEGTCFYTLMRLEVDRADFRSVLQRWSRT